MNTATDITYRPILESYSPFGRLGRHIEHDPLSRLYAFDTTGLTVTPVRHERHVPVFDQGDLGSCTGNAAVGVLATDPFWPTMAADTQEHLNEDMAVAVYGGATAIDDAPGQYPPDDTGSTGLAVAKVLTSNHLIAGYQHTFTFSDMLKALTVTPVLVGVNWYSSFDEPDADGNAKIAKHAFIRGGHEVYADEITSDQRIGFTSSWSDTWGLKGRFYLSFATVERLLGEDGDVTVLVPVFSPAPIPVTPPGPVTPPTDPDTVMWAAVRAWAKVKNLL